jgi:hypothetical protein
MKCENRVVPHPVSGILSGLYRGLLFCLLTICATVNAAEDGEYSSSSSGNLVIRLFMSEGVQIGNLDDVVFETTRNDISGNLTLSEEFCIKGSVGSQFQISTSTNVLGGSRFALVGDKGDALDYRVQFTSGFSGGDTERLLPGAPSQTRTIDEYFDCNTGNNVLIEVIFEEADILSSLSIEYTGILFITVQLV